MVLWNLNYWSAAGPESEMAKYSIVRGDWSPRPAYAALKGMASSELLCSSVGTRTDRIRVFC